MPFLSQKWSYLWTWTSGWTSTPTQTFHTS